MAALDELVIAGGQRRQEPATRPSHPPRGAMDWDDVRVFLAVAREGSMRAAGRALGLSQPTIARRLAAFEATFGGRSLFTACPRDDADLAGEPDRRRAEGGGRAPAVAPGVGRPADPG